MYKNNSRFSSNSEGCSPLQPMCNLTGMKTAIGYYSYTNRYGQNHKIYPALHHLRLEISPKDSLIIIWQSY